jgi:hypothetical protein
VNMKKLFLLLLLLPLLGRGLGGGLLSAQNVTVTNLQVTEGPPSTVTFDVSWERPVDPTVVWMDSAWVFVDYNKNGMMARLPLLLSSGATLTDTSAPGEGRIEEEPGNTKGMWVRGYARGAAGSFSAKVMLLTDATNIAGACAYASGYPPVGEYLDDTRLQFSGTPWYKIWLNSADGPEMIETGSLFFIPCGYTIDSFTDSTGAPGIFKCIPSTDIYDLTVSATEYCVGDAVTFALSNTTPGRTYRLYKDGNAVDVLTGTGGGETFTGAFAGAGEYTAWMDVGEKHCAAQMNGVHTVSESPVPTGLTFASTLATVCEGESVTLVALPAGAASYSIGSGWQASNTFSFTPSAADTYTLYIQTAAGCTASATDAVAVALNPLPAVPTGASTDSRCGEGTVTFSATVTDDCTIDWYTAGNSLVSSGTTSFSPSLTNTTAYHAQARNTTTGCVSATRLAVTGTVKPIPIITRVATSGEASQTAELRIAAITPIIYTANNSATISRTAGGFPGGITGAPSGSSFTISGTPSSTGTVGYTLTANANGCTSTAAGTITAILSTTLCTQCCYKPGSGWVNCYVTTNALSTGTEWSGYLTFYGATSPINGSANFATITASSSNYKATSAIGLCKSLGTGWFLPATEELYAMSSGGPHPDSNSLPGAGILTGGEVYHWSSTEEFISELAYNTWTVRAAGGFRIASGRGYNDYYRVHCAKLQ